MSLEMVFHRDSPVIRIWKWTICFVLLSRPLVHTFQPMRWCGGTLNPVQAAKAGKMSTDILFSCKKEIMTLNVRPAAIKEATRICAVYHLCFAVAQDDKNVSAPFMETFSECVRKMGNALTIAYPELKEKYNLNVNKTVDAFKWESTLASNCPEMEIL
ncbi:uncharacterized protein LOC144145157 isoform X2 [Haemaphysalis longicornis]